MIAGGRAALQLCRLAVTPSEAGFLVVRVQNHYDSARISLYVYRFYRGAKLNPNEVYTYYSGPRSISHWSTSFHRGLKAGEHSASAKVTQHTAFALKATSEKRNFVHGLDKYTKRGLKSIRT